MSTEALLTNLASLGWKSKLTPRCLTGITELGLRAGNAEMAAVITEIAVRSQPITLRGLFYRVVSAGMLPSTDDKHYNRVGRLVTRLRRAGVIPYQWIVDSLRSTNKPSSWSGLGDFADTVRRSYRKDFWEHLPNYVEFFVEKDAIAGVVTPVTREYDVALSPVRGYCSESFAHQIGSTWREIDKPIRAYYLGDYDPSGFDIERDLREKLERFSGKDFEFTRLGVNLEDFDDCDLIPLAAKKSDRRYQAFIRDRGEKCAEIDAIDPNELRRRVREAIEQWIPTEQWERLLTVEEAEKETFATVLNALGADL